MSEIRLHGRGGQGTVMAAEMLANAFVLEGNYASVFPSFGIERRGSAVMAFVRYGDNPIREKTRVYHPEILLVLDPSLLEKPEIYKGFTKGGIIVSAGKHPETILNMGVEPSVIAMVDGMGIALEETGTNITNVIMLGAFAKATGLVSLDHVRTAVEGTFSGKLLAKNMVGLQRGFDETVLHQYDVERAAEKETYAFEEKITSCKEPEPMVFESSWSDCTDKVKIINTGEWRFKRPILDKDGCKQCGICAMYCPIGCISERPSGYFVPDFTYCKGCGVCANECPAHAIVMHFEEELQ
ncbi:NADH-dependent phenylglyoxylate dehydrogenase subunit gamma [Pseudodesulfovibrio hydrargyri]|uniref:NADH-dependent phenylglyoxylate dehydrogenase subunit gamma n=1 Tax=Pseudodesulfovibrio hydrargyri TaxID=2125990 RepID=A0A1J5NFN7_9BACT|nr:2-oxoacid:acceptor oxidoreductase family protein [Pseudodesulfovibrio hydrargyri]OIQ50529.1 NADH-dependent phenylglyoxylate dehydrogenase subunit gamma [Pseudodesulfovibrio hydrargyri]